MACAVDVKLCECNDSGVTKYSRRREGDEKDSETSVLPDVSSGLCFSLGSLCAKCTVN